MSAPKQAGTPGTSARTGGAGGKATTTGSRARDKGTRGGRPEPQPPAPRAGAPGNGQGRPAARAQPPAAAGGQRSAGTTPAGAEAPGAPLWMQLATLALSLGGLGVSIWLTIAHYTTTSILACSGSGLVDCAKVTTSPESMVFGVVPVAVLGLAFYAAMTAATSPWAWRARWPAMRWARLAAAVLGMVFVLYLIYTELITLGVICLWCTGVHAITFCLFVLLVFSAAAGYGPARAPTR